MNKGVWFLVLMVVCLMGFTFTVGYSFVDSTMIYYGVPLALGTLCFLGLSYYSLEVFPRLEKERVEQEKIKLEVREHVKLPGKKLEVVAL
jgi:hypothetical protein